MDDDVKVPELEYVGTYEAMLKPPLEVPGPFGMRQILEIVGGEYRTASGERGELLTGAATGCSRGTTATAGSMSGARSGWTTARSYSCSTSGFWR
jgi:hypothetical protein